MNVYRNTAYTYIKRGILATTLLYFAALILLFHGLADLSISECGL